MLGACRGGAAGGWFRGFGFYLRSGFIHIDLGPARSWASASQTVFAAEKPPAREVLAESRTLKGGGVAGVVTIGAAGIEVAQERAGGDARRESSR